MKRIAAYAVFLGREIMDVAINVSIVRTKNYFVACYGTVLSVKSL